MKKEETFRRNTALKNECDLRSRSVSPKAYLGCGTCRSKKVTSNNKLNDWNTAFDKNSRKKLYAKKTEEEFNNQKVKFTDLCDEDKGRIVRLIEELSKLEEKNEQLQKNLEDVQKDRKNQQEHMLKQANLFLEDKKYFVNEIKDYKSTLKIFENKISLWENRARLKDKKIMYFAKALQKSLKEKNELQQLMNRLKTCLKNSLQSFQKLKDQVTELQHQEQDRGRSCISVSCQTEDQTISLKKKNSCSEDETEGEYFPACNQECPDAKNSLDVINDKLEYVCQCLKKKREKSTNSNSNSPRKRFDIDLSILLKNGNLGKKERTDDVFQKNESRISDCTLPYKLKSSRNNLIPPTDDPGIFKGENNKTERLSNLEKKCSKTLLEVENILKNIGEPLNAINECIQVQENHTLDDCTTKESPKDILRCSDFLQNRIIQKNNLFKISEDDQYEEDRILEELFYSDQNLTLGLDPNVKFDTKHCSDRPFTW